MCPIAEMVLLHSIGIKIAFNIGKLEMPAKTGGVMAENRNDQAVDHDESTRMTTGTIIGLILLILVVIFTLQNTDSVQLRFLVWQAQVSRALVFFIVLAIGIALGLVIGNRGTKRHVRAQAKSKHRPTAGS
jgi:uncharacterized integral membrane protein